METYTIDSISAITGKHTEMEFPLKLKFQIDEFFATANCVRPYIQVALPELTADQREFLMTGTTPEEWAELFGDDPE